ncbi:MAG: heat-shock protein Hsp20 [Neptuniibacter caesariensis]|uniref:Heat-shock protein Hsp20 n=1 Tax=Neptuniibacter caesariensis TaxID=207954 RepID=A0A2G6JB49_NEPCE|nr:MAG: heat-shock protein Hsp20 [Neptuniibacter caesariensis]
MNIIPRNFDSIFDDFFPSLRSTTESNFGQLIPRVDVEEQETQYLIKADLPGINKEDINVELQNGLLTIRAEHTEEKEDKKDGKVIRRERHSGSYARSFSVGKGVTEDDVSGRFENGVLTLTIPKKDNEEPTTKRINIA